MNNPPDIAEMPPSIAALQRDYRGFPVPWFVHWRVHASSGESLPDFGTVAAGKFERAIAGRRCWICGERLKRDLTFVVGADGLLGRFCTEPPSHEECVVYVIAHRPFLLKPIAPLVVVAWTTRSASLGMLRWPRRDATPIMVFRLGEPASVRWFQGPESLSRVDAQRALWNARAELFADHRGDDSALAEINRSFMLANHWLPSDGPPSGSGSSPPADRSPAADTTGPDNVARETGG